MPPLSSLVACLATGAARKVGLPPHGVPRAAALLRHIVVDGAGAGAGVKTVQIALARLIAPERSSTRRSARSDASGGQMCIGSVPKARRPGHQTWSERSQSAVFSDSW